MKNKIQSVILCILIASIVLCAIPGKAYAQQCITNRNDVRGRDYTKSSAMAAKLDSIFDGNASIYYADGRLVNTRLGTRNVPDPPSPTLYVGPNAQNAINSGFSCWIYANGVYYTLFNECTGNGDPGQNSVKLSIPSDSIASYSNFIQWGVRQGVGALIRSGTVNVGHSMIVLGYDSDSLTILDGNGDNHGLVAIRVYPWSEVNFTVAYIIQPKDTFYNDNFPNDIIDTYEDGCKKYSSYCQIKMTSDAYVMSQPCSRATDASSTRMEHPKVGDTYTSTGLFLNTAGNYWYRVIAKNGETGYVPSSCFSYVKALQDVKISGVSAPTDLPVGGRFSIQGNINTEYGQLTAVSAFVYPGNATSGNPSTGRSVQVNSNCYSLLNSEVDMGVEFNILPAGNYTYVVKAEVKNYYAKTEKTQASATKTYELYRTTFTVGGGSAPQTFTISYDANGGSGAPESQTKQFGATLTLSDIKPTRSGYIFQGWSTSPTATSATYAPGGKYTVNTSATLYAVWEMDQVTLTALEVNTLPNRFFYLVGRPLDTEGLTLKAKYSDGSSRIITSGFSISDYNSATPGLKSIQVEYEGMSTSFRICYYFVWIFHW